MKKYEYIPERDFQDLRELINRSVDRFGPKTAFIYKSKDRKTKTEISFSKFGEDIDTVSAFLIEEGLKGEKIAVIGPNSYEWVVLYYAVMNNVGILVPLDKGLPDDEIANSLKLSSCDFIVYDEEFKENIENIQKNYGVKLKKAISMDVLKQDKLPAYKPLVEKHKKDFKVIDKHETALIAFTSGTTSQAKAALLSHRNIASNVGVLDMVERMTPEDNGYIFLPLHHLFGSTGVAFLISQGITSAFCSGIKYFQRELKEYQVSTFFCVPLIIESMVNKVLKTADQQGKRKKLEMGRKIVRFFLKFGIDLRPIIFKEVRDGLGGNLRHLVSGAAPLSMEINSYIWDFGIFGYQGYGLTETSPVIAAENPTTTKPGTVGLAMPLVDVKLHEPNEEGIGELLVKGPNVMKGYMNNDELNKEVFIDGYFNTGDLASIDEEGFITIHGRLKNVVVLKNGKNIYPEEIEVLIDKLPYALENVVLGQEQGDDYRLIAAIVYDESQFKEGDDIQAIIDADIEKINEHMPAYKRIKEVFITTEPFEKTTTGKVKRATVTIG
ncbi:MAG TPA: long-chain fatty acid--CoA ligase [Mogibacterium sp.]|nr:long-chain fatty acid--CoA ligase [Mogibacterium sp.]